MSRPIVHSSWRAAVTLACALIATACSSSTAAPGSGIDTRGTWTYTATQTSPALSLSGSLVIDEQTGGSFSGRIDVREKDAHGLEHPRAGTVSGITLQAGSLDFDVFFDNTARRHVGRINGDTMTGAWAQNLSASGTFRAVRGGPR